MSVLWGDDNEFGAGGLVIDKFGSGRTARLCKAFGLGSPGCNIGGLNKYQHNCVGSL